MYYTVEHGGPFDGSVVGRETFILGKQSVMKVTRPILQLARTFQPFISLVFGKRTSGLSTEIAAFLMFIVAGTSAHQFSRRMLCCIGFLSMSMAVDSIPFSLAPRSPYWNFLGHLFDLEK